MAIIGEEGNGKSTLLKLIYDPRLVETYVEVSGTINRTKMIIGYLAQELSEIEKEQTAYEFCCDDPIFLDSSQGEIATAAGSLGLPLEMLYADRALKTFSGGEKVKLRMALLMLRSPDALLLDEPSNDIDIETLEWMESFIQSSSIPIMFISHDETLLERTANVIIHIEQLKRKTFPRHAVKRSGYLEYIEKRLEQFSRQEQMAKKEREEYNKQQERFRQIYQKVDHAQSSISRQDPHGGRLLKKKMKSVKSMENRFEREFDTMTEIPDSEDAILVQFSENIKIAAGKTILDFSLDRLVQVEGEVLARDINLALKGPTHVCIVGKNGSGKTTLLRKIAAKLLTRTDLKTYYMPQDYEETLDQNLTPVEFLVDSGKKDEITKAKTFLGSMKYTADECSHRISELSGGQKAKLLFLKMILDQNDVLILDEPTRNFSPLSNPVIRSVLKAFRGAIISVSHDRKYIAEVCSDVYKLTPTGLHKEYDNAQISD